MFVAASTRCFADLDFWQALSTITDLEFDKVEFYIDEQGNLRPQDVLSSPDEFYATFREKSRLAPIAFTLAHELDASAFEQLCKLCKSMRITQINVPSSAMGTPFNSEIDRLKKLVSSGAAEGVRIGLRTEAGRLSADAHTAVELCQAVDGLGIAFDPSYFLGEIRFEETIELVSKYTTHVFLRDSTIEQVQVQVGLGEVDYGRLVSQLEKYRYDRSLTVELFPEKTDKQQQTLELRKLRMLIDSLL